MRKIALVGPESTGKTTLAQALAGAYGAPWVEECARGYLEDRSGVYEEMDLECIASLQHDVELVTIQNAWEHHMDRFAHLFREYDPFIASEVPDKPVMVPEMPLVLCDTDMITVLIWARERYGRVDPRIERLVLDTPYDHWLLCRPDIPWVPDPLRESPHDRDRLFDVWVRTLQEFSKPFTILEGDREARMRAAMNMIDVLIEGDPVKEREAG